MSSTCHRRDSTSLHLSFAVIPLIYSLKPTVCVCCVWATTANCFSADLWGECHWVNFFFFLFWPAFESEASWVQLACFGYFWTLNHFHYVKARWPFLPRWPDTDGCAWSALPCGGSEVEVILRMLNAILKPIHSVNLKPCFSIVGARAFSCSAHNHCKSLPQHVRQSDCSAAFKSLLKTHSTATIPVNKHHALAFNWRFCS